VGQRRCTCAESPIASLSAHGSTTVRIALSHPTSLGSTTARLRCVTQRVLVLASPLVVFWLRFASSGFLFFLLQGIYCACTLHPFNELLTVARRVDRILNVVSWPLVAFEARQKGASNASESRTERESPPCKKILAGVWGLSAGWAGQ